jgi:hypothetical protein
MEAVLASVLIDVATRVGAPIVKTILEQTVGGRTAEIGGAVIDAIAGNAGVTPAALPDLAQSKPAVVEQAVKAAEAQAPDILIQWNVQQQQAIDLQRAEMSQGGPTWSWAWRPAWMWFLAALFLYRLVMIPIADAIAGSDLAAGFDIGVLMTLTTWFLALYMGGHTLKAIGESAVAAVGRWRSGA